MLSIQLLKFNLIKFFVVSCFILVTASNVFCQLQGFQPEFSRFKAMIEKDSTQLNLLIHSDLIYSHSNGLVENKVEHIHTILSGYIVYKQIAYEEFKIRKYEKWTLTNGIIHVTGTIDNRAFDIRLRFSGTYIEVLGQWELINWQSTKL